MVAQSWSVSQVAALAWIDDRAPVLSLHPDFDIHWSRLEAKILWIKYSRFADSIPVFSAIHDTVRLFPLRGELPFDFFYGHLSVLRWLLGCLGP